MIVKLKGKEKCVCGHIKDDHSEYCDKNSKPDGRGTVCHKINEDTYVKSDVGGSVFVCDCQNFKENDNKL